MNKEIPGQLQAYEIAHALVAIRPHPDGHETKLNVTNIESVVVADEMGFFIDFNYAQRRPLSKDWSAVNYRLYIGYYQMDGQFDSSTISLNRILDDQGHDIMQVESLKNMALVTDKLRKLKIWQPPVN